MQVTSTQIIHQLYVDQPAYSINTNKFIYSTNKTITTSTQIIDLEISPNLYLSILQTRLHLGGKK